MSPALAVFLKAPRLGTVKTRLAAEIGERHALRLYRLMVSRTLAAAGAIVERGEVVIGPGLDGGYYLIGGRTPLPALFRDMPWSTGAVLELTRDRLRRDGAAWSELPPLRDVNTAADARAEGLLT